MTQEQKVLANKIFNSIAVVITPELEKKYKTLEERLMYTRNEKMRITKEKLSQRGIKS